VTVSWKIAIRRLFTEICEVEGFDPIAIISSNREGPFVRNRRIVANKLRAEKYSFPKIGWVMDKDHTTIMHMVDKDYRARKNALCRERYVSRASIYTQGGRDGD